MKTQCLSAYKIDFRVLIAEADSDSGPSTIRTIENRFSNQIGRSWPMHFSSLTPPIQSTIIVPNNNIDRINLLVSPHFTYRYLLCTDFFVALIC